MRYTYLPIKSLFSLNKLHLVIILCHRTFKLPRGVLNNRKEKNHRGLLNQGISEAIGYCYVDLKLFLHKVGLLMHEMPITHGEGSLPGPTINFEIDFHRIGFETTLQGNNLSFKSLNDFVH